jgi:putative endonuclease
MLRGGCVYILTNKNHTVLYTGVTSNLLRRIYEHQSGLKPASFTNRYNVIKLVYYRFFPTIEEAIAEEKRIKGGNRKNKIRLINEMNPLWEDLFIKEVMKW